MTFDLVPRSLPACCVHGGYRTRVNQTLPHVWKWTIFETGRPKNMAVPLF